MTPSYLHSRSHYISRLKERYSIDLTEEEYDQLVKLPIVLNREMTLYDISPYRKLIIARVKDQNVISIYSKKVKKPDTPPRLITCIGPSMQLPLPKWMGYRGFSPEQFESMVNEKIKEVMELSKIHAEQGDKLFFTSNKKSKHLMAAAYFWNTRALIDINAIIKHLQE